VLALIAEHPRYGYEIIKEIEDRLAGTYTPSPGVVYPTLTMLEELGHATMTESNGKKFYTITEAGTAYLKTNKAAVDHALQRMQSVNSAHSGSRAPRAFFTRTGIHPGSNALTQTTDSVGANSEPSRPGALQI